MSRPDSQRRFLSVGIKLAVATVLVLAGASFVLFMELTQRERRHLIEAKAVAGSMVADLFAASCAAPVVFADTDAVAAELDKLRSNKSIVYAAVYASKEERTVGELNPARQPTYDFHRGRVASHLVERADGIEILKDIRDTHNRVVGFTVLRFSLDDENAAYQVSRRSLFWFALLTTAVTAVLLILLARRLIIRPLARVTEAAGRLEEGDLHARAEIRANDEVGKLALVFNRMGDAIVHLVQKATQAQQNLQDLFDNMLQAVFTVGPDGLIDDGVSAFAKQIFGDVAMAGRPVIEFLHLDTMAETEAASRMKLCLANIFGSDDLQWDLCEPDRLRQLKYRRDNPDGSSELRDLELDYAPIYKDGLIAKIMFLVKDVTEMRRLQAEIARREQQNQENLARIRQIAAIEPDIFNTFIAEARAVLDGCDQSLTDLTDPGLRTAAVNSLFRGMHTLKGNARMFKLTAVQDIAHATEDYFQKVRDGEVELNVEAWVAMHARLAEVRTLLGEFEKLGRQVLGGEQETPAQAALAFLQGLASPREEWQSELADLTDEEGEQVRERLLARAERLRGQASGHGFVNLTAAYESLLRALGQPGVRAEGLLPALQEVDQVLRITRAVASETGAADLWPYFLDEAKTLLRRLAARAGGDEGDGDHGSEVLQLAAAARSFALPSLGDLADKYRRAMTEEGLGAGAALAILEAWVADARNLVAMSSRQELEMDLLAHFRRDASELADRLASAAPVEVSDLVVAVIACARRHRFGAVEEAFAALAKAAKDATMDGPRAAETLRSHLEAYAAIRREVRENQAAEQLILAWPETAGRGEQQRAAWWAAAARAGLEHLTSFAESLSPLARARLVDDIRHFDVVIPAARGAKTGQAVQRVLENRIVALRESLRGLRKAVLRGRASRETLAPALDDLERAVLHLTTPSLGDVLAPVAATAVDLARDRGKALEEVGLQNLDLFLDAKVMRKLRNAVVHAVRNAIDHGLEAPDARISAGKPPRGHIDISAEEHEGRIALTIADDGRGVDLAKVKEIARDRGLVTPDKAATMSSEEAHELLFQAGFSTAASVSMVSGRGVGMDAIRTIAIELGGHVEITSVLGQGARLTLDFPIQAGKAVAAAARAPVAPNLAQPGALLQ